MAAWHVPILKKFWDFERLSPLFLNKKRHYL